MDLNINKKYMIFNVIIASTKDNRPYLRMTLSDEKGSMMSAIMFDSNKLKFSPEKSQVVNVIGILQYYNNVAQLKVSDMELDPSANAQDFLPKSMKDFNVMVEELTTILNKYIKSSYFVSLKDMFLNDEKLFEAFTKKPAAKSVHHAYINGLIEHSLSLMKLSILIADYYGPSVNKELLLMGALFHDVGKVYEIDSSQAFEYTNEGKLLGHLLLGMEILNGYISKIDGFPEEARLLLIHMIASHHGLLEYGSPKKPKTKEAMILHYIDNIDAKLATMDSIFEKEEVHEGGWTSYDRLMERQLYRHNLIPE